MSDLEDDDLIDLVFKCLQFKPRDRIKKENLIHHRFFQPLHMESENKGLTQLLSHWQSNPDDQAEHDESFFLRSDNQGNDTTLLLPDIATPKRGKCIQIYLCKMSCLYTIQLCFKRRILLP